MTNTTKMVASGALLAIGMVLPFLTGQIPEIGSRISPLHLPVLLCGFLCGWQYGLTLGVILPVLRSFVFGMPPLVPTAAAMAAEMGVYGLVTGLLYQHLPRRMSSVYISLLGAMVCGRIVWGLASIPLYGIVGRVFTVQLFLLGALINAIPAIIIQLVLIPVMVLTLQRAKVI